MLYFCTTTILVYLENFEAHCPKTLGSKILLLDSTLYKTLTCLSLDIKNPYSLYRIILCFM
jgi:hypothetical protein